MFSSALVIIIVILILKSFLYFINDRKNNNLKGPIALPLLGNALIFLGDSSNFLTVLHSLVTNYGNVASAYIFGQRYILLSHPTHIEAVMSSTEYNTKGISYCYLQPWLGQGLLTASGNRWKSHRKFLTPAFHFNILNNFLPVFYKNADILVGKLKSSTDGNASIDLFPLVALAALDNVTESIMGVSVNAQKDNESAYVKAIDEVSNITSARMRNPLFTDAIFHYLPHKRRQDKALEVLHGQTRAVIETRRKELEKSNITSLDQSTEFSGIKNKHAFLDLLLLAELDGKRIDDENIREEVDTFMFEVAGQRLPKNSAVVIDIIHMQRRADIYENPLEFKPERFENTQARNPFSWLSFSAGPRNCIGQKFAMLELKVSLSAILKNFRILPSNIEPVLSTALILRSNNGVHVKLVPRT